MPVFISYKLQRYSEDGRTMHQEVCDRDLQHPDGMDGVVFIPFAKLTTNLDEC